MKKPCRICGRIHKPGERKGGWADSGGARYTGTPFKKGKAKA